MLYLVNLGAESVLVEGNSEEQALRISWLDIIYNNCENGERSVEKFREELAEEAPEDREGFLRSYTRSLRNFGYSWADFSLKQIKCISEDTWRDLSDTYRIATW